MKSFEEQYLKIVMDCMYGAFTKRADRTGVGSQSVFGRSIVHDLADGFPLVTTRYVNHRIAFEEFLWMLRGETNIRTLIPRGVNIWNAWAYDAYKKQGGELSQTDFIERIKTDDDFADWHGDLGPIYGAQWRDWNGTDQLLAAEAAINNTPNSRRIIIEGWNVEEVPDMALPPCHKTYQFFVDEKRNTLSCFLYQRSADMLVGVPFNFANLALFTTLMADRCNLKPGSIHWTGVDCHVYDNHHEYADKMLDKKPAGCCQIEYTGGEKLYEEYTADDFDITGYQPAQEFKLPVAV